MTRQALIKQIETKKSVLCVGLDSDINRLPHDISKKEFPQFEFNKAIIDATAPYAIAYKPNLAFYESQGVNGWQSFEKTIDYIRENYPDIFIIADAKRGDIGNTSAQYAKAFFETMHVDAVTLSPYMGEDVVSPFLKYNEKWAVILGLTSNASANVIQGFSNQDNKTLFEHVLEISKQWGTPDNLMYVVGATKTEHLQTIRNIIPDHFLLVPGIGAQGGNLEAVIRSGKNADYGLIINSSRNIIFSDKHPDFQQAAKIAAKTIQQEMQKLLF